MPANPHIFGDDWRLRLAAPEKLDQPVVMLGPFAWLALLGALALIALALVWSVMGAIRVTATGEGVLAPSGLRTFTLHTAQPGVLLQALKPPARVEAGQPVAQVGATELLAPVAGQVMALHANEGAVLEAKARVLTLYSGGADLEAIVYVPVEEGKKVEAGMAVLLLPSVSALETGGSLHGVVTVVAPVASAEDDVTHLLAQRDLARRLLRNGPAIEVRVRLYKDPLMANGYAWTSPRGGQIELLAGTVLQGTVTLRSEPPIALALPALRRWFTVP